MIKDEYTRTRYACYATSVAMAAAVNISPLLFVTFRNLYGISYTLLGLLVAINFSTQLGIDLIFSFFSKHFNIHKVIRAMPVVNVAGLLIYVLIPTVLPDYTYAGLVMGTIFFSVASGMCEVLSSPVIAAIPSDNPEREISTLHSTYAWGVVGVVIFSTVFLAVVGTQNWKYLALILSVIPLSAALLFFGAKLPEMDMSGSGAKSKNGGISPGLILCFVCIFLGGAAECTMTQWISGFIESAMNIPKLWGDIFGMALFGALLGVGRSLYAKYGNGITKVMLWGMAGSALCYIAASISLNPLVGLIACAFTGLCTSMLWPGTIIYAGEKFPDAGVWVYALLAAGGDSGASVAPQILGIAADKVSVSSFALELSKVSGITTEQIGMRCGMLVAAVFPLVGLIIIICMERYFKKHR